MFYFGGGIEKGESKLKALKREIIEETGYTIKNMGLFDEIGSYFYSKTHGYIDVVASVYIVELIKGIWRRLKKIIVYYG